MGVRSEFIAGSGYEVFVGLDLRPRGGEHVAHDGTVDGYLHGSELEVGREVEAAAGKAQGGVGMDEPEDGDCVEYLFVGEGLAVGQGSARDGHEYIDGDRVGTDLAQIEGKFYALSAGLAHAYDSARADLHAGLTGEGYGREFLGLGVGSAEGGEVRPRGLEIAVVAADSGAAQTVESLGVEQPQGGAEPQPSATGELRVVGDNSVEGFA